MPLKTRDGVADAPIDPGARTLCEPCDLGPLEKLWRLIVPWKPLPLVLPETLMVSPTEKNVYCVIRSPFKDKDSREHFEIRTHKRLIDIHQPTPKTVDSLQRLDHLPAGVDIEIRLAS